MTSDRRFEQELPSLLDDLYMGPMPTYRDQILQHIARTSQRPAWSFLQRWLPMLATTRQTVVAPRIPWRSIGLAVLLAGITLAIVATLIAGSRPRVPAPFGPAKRARGVRQQRRHLYGRSRDRHLNVSCNRA